MEAAIGIVLHNLAWWSLGFLSGWGARRLVTRATHYAHDHGGPMRRSDRRHTFLAGVTTLVLAAAATVVIMIAERYGDAGRLQEVWNTCRHINYPLGVAVACGVMYRLVLMAWDRPSWRDQRALHVFAWIVYIALNLVAAAMTSHHYELAGVDATWVSGLRTLLMSGAVVLTVWWPHPQHFTPIEEPR